MITRNYYTLAEMCSNSAISLAVINGPFQKKKITPNQGIYDMLNSISGTTLGADDAYTKTLLNDYLWPEMWNEKVWYIDSDTVEMWDDDFDKAQECFAGYLWRILEETKERYEWLIVNYTAQLNNLMSDVSSTSTTLFNDTPQSGGDVTTSDYITNATTTSSKSDMDTKINRLDQIRKKLWSIYREWADEFKCLVLPEGR